MLQLLPRLPLASALVFSQINLLHHLLLPYPYTAGYLFLAQRTNLNKCFTDLFFIFHVDLVRPGVATWSISSGFRSVWWSCWIGQYNTEIKGISLYLEIVHKKERVHSCLRDTKPSVVFLLPQAVRLFIMHVSYCHHITLLITEDGYSLSCII